MLFHNSRTVESTLNANVNADAKKYMIHTQTNAMQILKNLGIKTITFNPKTIPGNDVGTIGHVSDYAALHIPTFLNSEPLENSLLTSDKFGFWTGDSNSIMLRPAIRGLSSCHYPTPSGNSYFPFGNSFYIQTGFMGTLFGYRTDTKSTFSNGDYNCDYAENYYDSIKDKPQPLFSVNYAIGTVRIKEAKPQDKWATVEYWSNYYQDEVSLVETETCKYHKTVTTLQDIKTRAKVANPASDYHTVEYPAIFLSTVYGNNIEYNDALAKIARLVESNGFKLVITRTGHLSTKELKKIDFQSIATDRLNFAPSKEHTRYKISADISGLGVSFKDSSDMTYHFEELTGYLVSSDYASSFDYKGLSKVANIPNDKVAKDGDIIASSKAYNNGEYFVRPNSDDGYDDDDQIYCDNCGEYHDEDISYYHDGNNYCEYCYNDIFTYCEVSNQTIQTDESIDAQGYNRTTKRMTWLTVHADYVFECELTGSYYVNEGRYKVEQVTSVDTHVLTTEENAIDNCWFYDKELDEWHEDVEDIKIANLTISLPADWVAELDSLEGIKERYELIIELMTEAYGKKYGVLSEYVTLKDYRNFHRNYLRTFNGSQDVSMELTFAKEVNGSQYNLTYYAS